MAVALQDTIITKIFNAVDLNYSTAASSTSSETFTFSLNNSNDDILLVIDASKAVPATYTVTFNKGDYPTAKTPGPVTVYDGFISVIAIESAMIEKKNATASITVTSSISNIGASGIRIAVIKKRFVTNN
ncbi:MAG TPA: hypothetical protein PLD48_02180 [Bacillota bacterium]|nr:hypothetical protein [Bacillota bacterium]HOK68149.1 hypothetical protein [Bacillota bacterium]HPP84451.1 hypothetical protein [Bacillota bacterium]